MANKVQIARRAILTLGGQTISALDGSSTEAIVAEEYYDLAKNEALAAHPWTFATTRKEVDRFATAPTSQWDAAYNYPSVPAPLAIQSVHVNDIPIPYELEQGTILCDAAENDVVVCEYTYDADESLWPPYFESFMVQLLAAYCAYPLTRQADLEVARKQEAAGSFRSARFQDSRQQTARRARVNRLTTQIR